MIQFLDWLNAILSHPAIFKVAVIMGLLILFRIYASQKGAFGMDKVESKEFFSFLLFYGAFLYMLRSERHRITEYHVFSEFLYVCVITGLFSVLHLDKIFPILTTLIEAITKLILARKGAPAVKEEVTDITAQVTKKTMEIPAEEKPKEVP